MMVWIIVHHVHLIVAVLSTVAMIEFTSSNFSGSESSKVISVGIMISNGVTSSKDISISVTFMPINTTNG